VAASSPLNGVEAIVLAGGLGTRLRSVVGDTPKVLAPVDGTPFLDLLLARLADLGAGRAILSLGYRADAVVDHLKTHSSPLPVEIVIEPEPMGTAGGVRLAAKRATTDPVLVINGDTWVEADYGAFLTSHRQGRHSGSILCAKVEDARAFGRIEIGGDGIISRFAEKNLQLTGPGIVSAGVYLFGRTALAALEATPGPSLENDFFAGFAPGRVHGYIGETVSFIDIGTPAGLALASTRLKRR
jgi:NDP-sugar pyrophosphorylase family protein